MPVVEQNKLKRAGTGLRAVDHDRAFPGFTLFAPMSGGGNVYLIDLDGKLIHSWRMPYPPGNYGYLTDRGTLFYNGKTWRIQNASSARNRGRAAPCSKQIGTDAFSGKCVTPIIIMMAYDCATATFCCSAWIGFHSIWSRKLEVACPGRSTMVRCTRIIWSRWRTWEHLDPQADCITAVQERREEWAHGNAVAELSNGDIVVSFRTISTVIIIDRKTGKIIWKLGAPPLCGQHAPTPLPNGQPAHLRQRATSARSCDAFFTGH
jgi:Arylsulfotransferase (ASST)